MKKGVLFIVAAVLSVAISGLALAALTRSTSIDRHQWHKTGDPVSTSSREWRDIPGLDDAYVCAEDGLTASVTLDIEGASQGVAIRALWGNDVIAPGAYHVDTGGIITDRNTTSLNFARKLGTEEPRFHLQWRSPSGDRVTLHSSTLVVAYDRLEEEGCI